MPKVSIIVTAYNIENYIRESLDCVLAQTLKDIEIIIVDDGSSDATPQIIREYADRDTRIVPILFEQNTIGGVASAANAGMDVATGDYIGFADGDDLYEPHMFEALYEAAERTGSDLAMSQYWLLDESDGQLKEPAEARRWTDYTSETTIALDEARTREILQFISVPWRKIYRRDLVERIHLRFPVGDFFFEDNPFHWASVIAGTQVVLLPEKLCSHRVARAGQTMSTVDERLLRIFEHHDIIRDWLIEHNEHATYRRDLLQWVAMQLSWVSQRAEGDVRRALFDKLAPVIGQYDGDDIEDFAGKHGRGRTMQMLAALKAHDFAQFSKAAGWIRDNGEPAPAATAEAIVRRSEGQSLLAWGMYHLRHSGPLHTARLTASYVGMKLQRRLPESIRRRTSRHAARALKNEDLMAALVILQTELRTLRRDVRDLRRRIDSDD